MLPKVILKGINGNFKSDNKILDWFPVNLSSYFTGY